MATGKSVKEAGPLQVSYKGPVSRQFPLAEVSCTNPAGHMAKEAVSFTFVTTNVVRTTASSSASSSSSPRSGAGEGKRGNMGLGRNPFIRKP